MEEIKILSTYNSKSVKQILGIGKNSLTNLVKKGQIVPKVIGKKYVFLGEDILKFIRAK